MLLSFACYNFFQHVMKFAEMTQEVQVPQTPSHKIDFGLISGRRRANQVSNFTFFLIDQHLF